MAEHSDLDAREIDVVPILAVQIDGESGPTPADISASMGHAFGALQAFVAEAELDLSGPPRAIYRAWGPEGTAFTVAFPVARGASQEPTGEIYLGEMEGGRTLRFTHHGPYEQLQDTYQAIGEWMRAHGRLATEADWARYMPVWEEYVNDPESTPPEELLTYIYLPVLEPDAA